MEFLHYLNWYVNNQSVLSWFIRLGTIQKQKQKKKKKASVDRLESKLDLTKKGFGEMENRSEEII